jgi:hypothetical protein
LAIQELYSTISSEVRSRRAAEYRLTPGPVLSPHEGLKHDRTRPKPIILILDELRGTSLARMVSWENRTCSFMEQDPETETIKFFSPNDDFGRTCLTSRATSGVRAFVTYEKPDCFSPGSEARAAGDVREELQDVELALRLSEKVLQGTIDRFIMG